MKIRTHICTALAVLGSTLALAEDERKPEPPPQPRPQESPRPAMRRAPMTRPTVFLGVATSPVPPVLTAQLNLPEGFGLVVDEVMPESPAGKAGVQQFDVLRLFNDQQLLDPQQLATLVRAQSKGSEVTLTLLRKGQEQKVTIKISERSMPERRPVLEPGGEMKERMERMKEGVGEGMRKMQEQMRDYEKRLREYQERFKNRSSTPGEERPKPTGTRSSARARGICGWQQRHGQSGDEG